MTGKKKRITDLEARLADRERASRNLLESLECTDAGVSKLADSVETLLDVQESMRSISMGLEQLGKRIATLEDRFSPPECQSEATSQHMSASNDTNQSDSSDSVGRSADLRTRIASVLLPDLEYAAAYNPTSESPEDWAASLADAVIRELGMRDERKS